ncbi:UPF0696 protein C11orf68 homolog [Macrobrachium rosenbergii]|uniref:UPF0696 protein C11orf68 homolog n=1 Tax=Macrobrachium rosenbergii TaxID=79674 RepID=UPI0034D697CA
MAEGNTFEYESEFLAEINKEADAGDWIEFDASVEDINGLDTFLQKYKPSVLKRSDGIGWICVRGPDHKHEIPALRKLLEDWEAKQTSGQRITPDTVIEMAKKYRCLCGKWLIQKETGIKVDLAWAAIAKAVASGQCGISAKVSPVDDLTGVYQRKNVVCVYNSDFTDRSAVEKLNDSIRNAGVKCTMTYKPDVYTYLGIYRNNKWGIKPTIYSSQFDLMSGKSKIVETLVRTAPQNPDQS